MGSTSVVGKNKKFEKGYQIIEVTPLG